MYSFWHENMFKILTVSGAPPQTLRESLRRSQDPLVARGFLSSAVAASRLRRLQFPHGLKSNYIKERWLMRLGGICARGLGGDRRPWYQQLLGYSKTRWLALVPAVGRLIDMFEPLKSYFLSENKCPTALKKFFTNPVAECWLLFAHEQAASFHETVLEVEGQNISMVEVGAALERLKAKLLERRDNKFVPAKVRMLLTCFEDDGLVNLSQFMNAVDDYYQTSIDYLEQWTSHFLDVTNFRWMTLTKAPLWTEVN